LANGRLLWTVREPSKAIEIITMEIKKQEINIILQTWVIEQWL